VSNEVDLTRGIYRRIWSGALTGQRINAVPEAAELLFWRLHMIADDFGNTTANPDLVRKSALPLRHGWTQNRTARVLEALKDGRLIDFYRADGEQYLHIIGFTTWQPAGKNGRRIRRFPVYPGESEGIQGEPDLNGAPHSVNHSEDVNHTEDDTEEEESAGADLPVVALAWNQLGRPYPAVRTMTKRRKAALRLRLADPTWDWRAALEAIPNSPFLRGENDRTWVANFDWFLRPESVNKVLEGQYEQGQGHQADRRGRDETPQRGKAAHYDESIDLPRG